MTTLRWAWVLAVLTVVVLLLIGSRRPGLERSWGDEATYLAMARSAAEDLDLRFDERDLERETSLRPDGPDGLILQRTDDGIFYSKPVLLALLAAPLVRVAGDLGVVLCNGLLLVAALGLGFMFLRRLGGEAASERALLTVVTFACTGVVLPYVPWRMMESLEVALVLGGLALGLGWARGSARAGCSVDRWIGSRAASLLGCVLLGAAATLRYPNAALAAAPAVAALCARRPQRGALCAAAAALGFVLVTVVTILTIDAWSPYKTERTAFSAATGFPAGAGAEAALRRFEDSPATNRLPLKPPWPQPKNGYAALYFLVGRHTGMFWYLPCAVLFGWLVARRPDRTGIVLLAAACAVGAFYLLWWPRNYFGGGTMLGNRYFLPAYPAFLVALRELPRPRQLLLPWLVAAIVGSSALVSVLTTAESDRGSQSHTSAGIFRLLPYESTARSLDGSSDRYWSTDFVRFVDPFAEPAPWSFRLRTGQPTTELLVGRRESGPMRLMVRTSAPELELRVGIAPFTRSYRIESHDPGVVIEVGRRGSWRRHSFWWRDFEDREPYDIEMVRLRLLAPEGAPSAVAEVRYLGTGRLLEFGYDREVLSVELPSRADAGSEARVPVRVRNTGRQWGSERVLPVRLGYRLYPIRDGEVIRSEVIEGERVPLPGTPLSASDRRQVVERGAELQMMLPVEWPARPGRYELVVDLIADHVAWFEAHLGEPIGRATVDVGSGP